MWIRKSSVIRAFARCERIGSEDRSEISIELQGFSRWDQLLALFRDTYVRIQCQMTTEPRKVQVPDGVEEYTVTVHGERNPAYQGDAISNYYYEPEYLDERKETRRRTAYTYEERDVEVVKIKIDARGATVRELIWAFWTADKIPDEIRKRFLMNLL